MSFSSNSESARDEYLMLDDSDINASDEDDEDDDVNDAEIDVDDGVPTVEDQEKELEQKSKKPDDGCDVSEDSEQGWHVNNSEKSSAVYISCFQ